MKVRRKVLVAEGVHSRFLRSINRGDAFPACFLLGEDKNKTIVGAEYLRHGWKGCNNMPEINPREMARASVVLIKNNLKPVGIARVGNCINRNKDRSDERGEGIFDVLRMSKGRGFMVTISDIGVMVDFYSRGKYNLGDYLITQNPKRKGVRA